MTPRKLVLIGLSLVLGACGLGIQGSGVRHVETRELPVFTAIDAAGTGQLAVTVDGTARDTVTLEIEGDDNIVPLVSTTVIDGELVVRLDTDSPLYDKIPLRLRVAIPALAQLQSSDSIDVRVVGVTGESLVVDATDSSDVTLSGQSAWLEIHGSKSADIHARELRANEAAIIASGTSDVTVCATDALTIQASGSSDVTYYCEPASIDHHVTGSADVTTGRD